MKTTIHDEPEAWATAAAVGGLTETELKAWNDHVAACPACQEIQQEELLMSELIKKTLDSESPDSGFERRIISKFRQVHAGNENRRSEFLQLFPILAGGMACLALIALFEIGSPTQSEKPALAGPVTPEIDLKALPAAVEQTIQTELAGKTVTNIERVADNGEISYAIETMAQDGREWDLTVAEDGSLLSIDTALTELPAAVQTAINTQVGQGSLEGVEKLFDDGETSYRAGITAPNDVQRDFTFAEDGTLLSREVNLTELPAAVQTAVNAQVGQGKLEGIDKSFDEGDITYDATMTTPDGQERDFSISKEGNLLSREVSLKEVPAAVQQMISQTLGTGKVIGIDQSFVASDQAISYDIEGQRNGKSFDFMISPDGHFLGMEE